MRELGPEPNLPAITGLLLEWHAGSQEAFHKLVPAVYGSLRAAAVRQLQSEPPGRLRPTELVHEVFLRLDGGQNVHWENRGHFFAIAARLMRQVLVGHARARKAAKRGGGQIALVFDEHIEVAGADLGWDESDLAWLIDLDDALTALASEDRRKSEIVEMRYFGGMTCPEIATETALSISTIEREIRMSLAWLRMRIGRESPLEQTL